MTLTESLKFDDVALFKISVVDKIVGKTVYRFMTQYFNWEILKQTIGGAKFYFGRV